MDWIVYSATMLVGGSALLTAIPVLGAKILGRRKVAAAQGAPA